MTKPLPDHIKEFIHSEKSRAIEEYKGFLVPQDNPEAMNNRRDHWLMGTVAIATANHILSQADEKVEGKPKFLCVAGCSAYSYSETHHHKDCGHYPETFSKMYDDLQQKVAGLEETHRLQLAGIMTASMQNTHKTIKDRLPKDNPYWTVAYQDVCDAVDREVAHREAVDDLKTDALKLVNVLNKCVATYENMVKHYGWHDLEYRQITKALAEWTKKHGEVEK